MTPRGRSGSVGEPLSRAFYDIALVLESAEDAEARVTRVLELLRTLVPYERCALLETTPGGAPRLVTAPGTPPEERDGLMDALTVLLGRLVDDRSAPSEPPPHGMHLAVPLVGLDEVIGVLFVRSAADAYLERHVRALSVVAAKLAAYFSMLRARALQAERSHLLAEAQQATDTANRAKGEFLALVSHELRTPLTTILAWADALRSTDTREADRARAFDAIERSVRAQALLIEELLDLSCVATATLRLDVRAVEPARLIQEVLQALRPRAEQKSIRLEATLDESVTPLVADPKRLSQVVANLVSNAIKFTPDGGHVEVHLERAGVYARIRVKDSGAGIRPEFLPHVFEPFRQGDSSTTRAYGGLGIGLALVKDLAELHGGHVRAESPGETKGATFTVDLPLAGPSPSDRPPSEAPPNGQVDGRALAGIRVLVVDDDLDICEVLQFVLEGQGAAVAIAVSAAEALASLERSMPDVLLSDVAMPDQSGYDLMRMIAARPGAHTPPAAALTGYAPAQDIQRALAAGFRMQLAKPVEPAALIAAVAALASGTGGHDPHPGEAGLARSE